MSGGYVICEYEKLKEELPWFKDVLTALRSGLIAQGQKDWSNMTFGGSNPKAGQFGLSTIMPQLFADRLGTRLITWNMNVGLLGHQVLMQGAAAQSTLAEDYKVGIAGLCFLDKVQRITEIKMQISDKKLPRINIEEIQGYNKPCVVLEDWFLLDEETGFELYGYAEATGPQRLKLLGAEINKVPNKLQTTNTGAALL